MDLSIIILAYQAKEKLRETLQAVLASEISFSYEVTVVDNNSDDGSADMVENEFVARYPNIILVRNRSNEGFAKGNNLGFKNSSGKYILFLNPDTAVQKNVLDQSLKYLQAHEDIGALGVKLIFANGKLDPACRRSFPNPWNAFFRLSGLAKLFPKSKFSNYNLNSLPEDQEADVDSLVGAFMLMPRSVFEKAKYFDEDYFMYGEDIDLCYKIKQLGLRIFYYPRLTVYHYKGQSSRKKPCISLYWFHNAMWIFYRKHYKQQYPFFMNWLVYIAIWCRFYLLLFLNSLRKEKFVSKNI